MCAFIDTEVVLANLLQADHENNGVSFKDLENYCHQLSTRLYNMPGEDIRCISLQIYKNELENVVNTYPDLFQSYRERYYKGPEFNLGRFDRRTKASIREAMSEVAMDM